MFLFEKIKQSLTNNSESESYSQPSSTLLQVHKYQTPTTDQLYADFTVISKSEVNQYQKNLDNVDKSNKINITLPNKLFAKYQKLNQNDMMHYLQYKKFQSQSQQSQNCQYSHQSYKYILESNKEEAEIQRVLDIKCSTKFQSQSQLPLFQYYREQFDFVCSYHKNFHIVYEKYDWTLARNVNKWENQIDIKIQEIKDKINKKNNKISLSRQYFYNGNNNPKKEQAVSNIQQYSSLLSIYVSQIVFLIERIAMSFQDIYKSSVSKGQKMGKSKSFMNSLSNKSLILKYFYPYNLSLQNIVYAKDYTVRNNQSQLKTLVKQQQQKGKNKEQEQKQKTKVIQKSLSFVPYLIDPLITNNQKIFPKQTQPFPYLSPEQLNLLNENNKQNKKNNDFNHSTKTMNLNSIFEQLDEYFDHFKDNEEGIVSNLLFKLGLMAMEIYKRIENKLFPNQIKKDYSQFYNRVYTKQFGNVFIQPFVQINWMFLFSEIQKLRSRNQDKLHEIFKILINRSTKQRLAIYQYFQKSDQPYQDKIMPIKSPQTLLLMKQNIKDYNQQQSTFNTFTPYSGTIDHIYSSKSNSPHDHIMPPISYTLGNKSFAYQQSIKASQNKLYNHNTNSYSYNSNSSYKLIVTFKQPKFNYQPYGTHKSHATNFPTYNQGVRYNSREAEHLPHHFVKSSTTNAPYNIPTFKNYSSSSFTPASLKSHHIAEDSIAKQIPLIKQQSKQQTLLKESQVSNQPSIIPLSIKQSFLKKDFTPCILTTNPKQQIQSSSIQKQDSSNSNAVTADVCKTVSVYQIQQIPCSNPHLQNNFLCVLQQNPILTTQPSLEHKNLQSTLYLNQNEYLQQLIESTDQHYKDRNRKRTFSFLRKSSECPSPPDSSPRSCIKDSLQQSIQHQQQQYSSTYGTKKPSPHQFLSNLEINNQSSSEKQYSDKKVQIQNQLVSIQQEQALGPLSNFQKNQQEINSSNNSPQQTPSFLPVSAVPEQLMGNIGNQPLGAPGEQLQYVIKQYQGGSRYEGYYMDNKRNGYGKFYYQQGSYYEGEWKDNQMNGYGKLYYSNGQLAYEGEWLFDQFHGVGIVYNDNPTMLDDSFDYSNFNNLQEQWVYYEGQLKNDLKQGKGKIMLQNGEYFQGQFSSDKINGEGKFTNMYGQVIHGVWKDSKLVEKIELN